MGTYIPFTEEQREQARLTDLAAFLRQCGEEVKRSGSENMWLDHGQKVTIRGNLWFHQYEQVGGDAVDFVHRFYNLDYREAVLTLTSMGIGVIREPVEPFVKKPLQIPAKYENMRRVYGYLLRRRGIDKEVLDTFAYRGLVYECERYHNAVFVGTDKAGKVRHIHKRSTAAQGGFKGNEPGANRSTASTGTVAAMCCISSKHPSICCPLSPCSSTAGKARAMRHPVVYRTRFCGRC